MDTIKYLHTYYIVSNYVLYHDDSYSDEGGGSGGHGHSDNDDDDASGDGVMSEVVLEVVMTVVMVELEVMVSWLR